MSLGQELGYAVGAYVGSLWVVLPPRVPRFDGRGHLVIGKYFANVWELMRL